MTPKSPFLTIGHSTRSLEELIDLLEEQNVASVADVRRFPMSKRHPQFNVEVLGPTLAARKILYTHVPELGGRRRGREDSPNSAWRNDSFRAYADHMASEEFRGGIARLLELPRPAAVMCAEAVPWRCHRNLIADELLRLGLEVEHIVGPASMKHHQLNPAAVDRGSHLEYPATPQEDLPFRR